MRTSQVDRLEAKDLTLAQFRSEYDEKRRPVVIAGGASAWKARAWTVDHLKEVLGDRMVQVNHNPTKIFDLNESTVARMMPFREAADVITSTGKGTYYLQQVEVRAVFPELLPDIPMPEFLDQKAELDALNLWFGAAGCISPLHFDKSDNFLAQIMGTKRLFLFAPSDGENLYPNRETSTPHVSRVDAFRPDYDAFPRFADAQAFETVLGPGDILFIPTGWWHAVETVETSFSLNFWWASPAKRAARLDARCRWVDLFTHDVAAASAFYAALFGWTIDEGAGSTCSVGGRTIGRIRRGATTEAHWVPYLNVTNAEELAAKAKANGGDVVAGSSSEEANGDRRLIVVDPAGAAIGLWQHRERDESEPLEVPGSIRVIELFFTPDQDQVAFHAATFGWSVSAPMPTPKGTYRVFAQELGVPVGGALPMPAAAGDARSHWIPYFRVADCSAIAQKISELGGSIVVPPTDMFRGRVFITIARDPTGAMFAMIAV